MGQTRWRFDGEEEDEGAAGVEKFSEKEVRSGGDR